MLPLSPALGGPWATGCSCSWPGAERSIFTVTAYVGLFLSPSSAPPCSLRLTPRSDSAFGDLSVPPSPSPRPRVTDGRPPRGFPGVVKSNTTIVLYSHPGRPVLPVATLTDAPISEIYLLP